MTRRSFLQKILVAGSTVLVAGWALAKTVLPRRFLWAKPLSKYPGRLKTIANINSQSKWSG
ncbi:MAG: hypothetical protein ABSG22_12150 [Sedimentisphaerales bacterium]|jgi:hypothetical protein